MSRQPERPSTNSSGRPVGPNCDLRVHAVKVLIEDNFHRHLDLSEMAKTVDLSLWHLAHLFKDEIGISPVRYLSLVRLKRARQYLETRLLSVREIASSVGIHNPSHFSRSFKAVYGLSPLQHRNNHFRIATPTTDADEGQSNRRSSQGHELGQTRRADAWECVARLRETNSD